MKKKHIFPLILGCVLILLQLLSCTSYLLYDTWTFHIDFSAPTFAWLFGYFIIGILGAVVLSLTLYSIFNPKQKKININDITKIAILTAIASVIMLLEFPLWFAPGFYKLDLSEAIILMGGFAMGPVAAAVMELLKNLINLLLNGTTTAGIGEFANFLIGCSFVVPASMMYKLKKSRKGAISSLIIGTFSLTLIGSLLNYFMILPAYANIAGFPLDAIVDMGSAVNPFVTDLKTLVVFATAPFNLIKGIACSIINLLLYKRLSKPLHI